MILPLPDWATYIVAVLVLVLGVGRLVRIIYYDDFPLSVKLRILWDRVTGDSLWNKLFHCPWCLTPWVMLGAMGWFALGLYQPWAAWSWWLFWGWMALSYVATMIIVRDEPEDHE